MSLPSLRALTSNRRVGAVLLGLAIAVNLLALQLVGRGDPLVDVWTYVAAGERLNAAHPLYALQAGDRSVSMIPGMWTTPLVSSPTIAVLWRPLVVLPWHIGAALWWVACLACLIASVVILYRRQPVITAVMTLVLCLPIASQVLVGNVNSMILLGLIVLWRDWVTGRDTRVGIVAGLIAVLKITPVTILWWLLVTGSRRAFLVAVATVVFVAAVGVIGAGIQAHLDYLAMLRAPSSIGVYPLSLAGRAMAFGASEETARLMPWIFAVGGSIAVLLLRKAPASSYGAAVLTLTFGSPAVSLPWFLLLFALIAPLAYPLGDHPRELVLENVDV